MSNSLQILCFKDIEGYWSEDEMSPALSSDGLLYISCRCMKTTTQSG